MTLTDAETKLICSLLHQYRLDLLRAIKAPPEKSQLTPQGVERYWSDVALAEAAAEKLEPARPALRVVR